MNSRKPPNTAQPPERTPFSAVFGTLTASSSSNCSNYVTLLVYDDSNAVPPERARECAGLVKQLHANTITLEDANIVTRLVTDGTSARQQAARLYLSPRVAQRRVHTVATHLVADAA